MGLFLDGPISRIIFEELLNLTFLKRIPCPLQISLPSTSPRVTYERSLLHEAFRAAGAAAVYPATRLQPTTPGVVLAFPNLHYNYAREYAQKLECALQSARDDRDTLQTLLADWQEQDGANEGRVEEARRALCEAQSRVGLLERELAETRQALHEAHGREGLLQRQMAEQRELYEGRLQAQCEHIVGLEQHIACLEQERVNYRTEVMPPPTMQVPTWSGPPTLEGPNAVGTAFPWLEPMPPATMLDNLPGTERAAALVPDMLSPLGFGNGSSSRDSSRDHARSATPPPQDVRDSARGGRFEGWFSRGGRGANASPDADPLLRDFVVVADPHTIAEQRIHTGRHGGEGPSESSRKGRGGVARPRQHSRSDEASSSHGDSNSAASSSMEHREDRSTPRTLHRSPCVTDHLYPERASASFKSTASSSTRSSEGGLSRSLTPGRGSPGRPPLAPCGGRGAPSSRSGSRDGGGSMLGEEQAQQILQRNHSLRPAQRPVGGTGGEREPRDERRRTESDGTEAPNGGARRERGTRTGRAVFGAGSISASQERVVSC